MRFRPLRNEMKPFYWLIKPVTSILSNRTASFYGLSQQTHLKMETKQRDHFFNFFCEFRSIVAEYLARKGEQLWPRNNGRARAINAKADEPSKSHFQKFFKIFTCILVSLRRLMAFPHEKIWLANPSKNNGTDALLSFMRKPCDQKYLSERREKIFNLRVR